MKSLLAVVLLSVMALLPAQACEKHLQGHQSGSDTNQEGQAK